MPFPLHPTVSLADVGSERFGRIVAHVEEFNQFVLVEYGIGHKFAVVRQFTDPAVFDALFVGAFVRFRATKTLPRIVSIEILPS